MDGDAPLKIELMDALPVGTHSCACTKLRHKPRMVVMTGGPGGGKTAILELARLYLCRHVVFIPEAASIVFSGGFPRIGGPEGRRASQRAIYRIQREMEDLALRNRDAGLIVCDRGTMDGLAYWPGDPRDFFASAGTSREAEIARYSGIIHIRTPLSADQYQQTGIRHESLAQARVIDRRIGRLWTAHSRHREVDAETDFIDKASRAIELLRGELPACCRI